MIFKKAGGRMTRTERPVLVIDRIELPTPLPVGPVNAFLVSDGEKYILIDCGTNHPATERVLLDGLRVRGIEPADLAGLVLTHGHVDHVGLTKLFQDEGVPVYAPPFVDTWLHPKGPWDTYRSDFYQNLYMSMGVPKEQVTRAIQGLQLLQSLNDRSVVDVSLVYNAPLPCLPEFKVLHVPGHAQHALALWNPNSRELIVGDQLLPHISSNALVEPMMTARRGESALRTKSLLQYRDNLKVLQNLPIEVVHPGHGESFSNVSDLIGRRLSDQQRRRDEFAALLEPGETATTYELAIRYFPHHSDQLQLIFSETLGYLDWLVQDGVLAEIVDGAGNHHWRRI